MDSQFYTQASTTPSENSMVHPTDTYNNGSLASSTNMFQRLTIQDNSERLQQENAFNCKSLGEYPGTSLGP